MMAIYILIAGLFLAYSNGANDNFKGVATLFGCGASGYRKALYWATLTTFLGSFAGFYVSQGLIASFSGKGLVPDVIVHAPSFLIAVSIASALTVFIAAIAGFPVSTTHALIGALMGAGFASGGKINFYKLIGTFFSPLLFSPIASFLLSVLVYPALRKVRMACGVTGQTCLCIDGRDEIVQMSPGGTAVLAASGLTLTVDQVSACRTQYLGSVMGVGAQDVLDKLHYLSSGIVSFGRGLNDTPKIAALLLASQVLGIKNAVLVTGVAIALGGIISAGKVAETMSRKITGMNHGQGFTANLITSSLVILASFFGLPVSTTHVACGSLFGIGLVNGKADWSVVGKILFSWFLTLPVAGILAWMIIQV